MVRQKYRCPYCKGLHYSRKAFRECERRSRKPPPIPANWKRGNK